MAHDTAFLHGDVLRVTVGGVASYGVVWTPPRRFPLLLPIRHDGGGLFNCTIDEDARVDARLPDGRWAVYYLERLQGFTGPRRMGWLSPDLLAEIRGLFSATQASGTETQGEARW